MGKEMSYGHGRIGAIQQAEPRSLRACPVLLVEPDDRIAALVTAALDGEMSVAVVRSRQAAIEALATAPYEVVAIGAAAGGPRIGELCDQLRITDPGAQLLALVVQPDAARQIARLGLVDVDGFLVLPCPRPELLARVRAARRRAVDRVERAGVVVKPRGREVRRHGRVIPLAKTEFALLVALLRANGAVLSVEQLTGRTRHLGRWRVRQTVMTLRRKLGDPVVIHSVRGFGYRFR